MPIQSLATATFTFYESGYTSSSAPVLIYGYVGDGWSSTTDATSPAVLLGSYDPTAGLGLHTVTLDAAAVRSVIGSSGWTGWLGIRLVGGINTNTQLNGPLGYNPPTLNFTLGTPPTLPSVSINDVTVTEGTSYGVSGATSTTPATFTVSLSQASSYPVTVAYQTVDGSAKAGSYGYVPTSGVLIFASGQTTQNVTVPVYADNAWESTQTFSLQLSAANATVSKGVGIGTILDDDSVPHVTIGNNSVLERDSGISSASFMIGLTNPSSQSFVIQYTTADGTARSGQDYVATTGSVVIGAYQTSIFVSVGIIGNKVVEPNKTFNLVITNGNGAIVDPGTQGVMTIVNDDHAPVVNAGPNQTVTEAAPVLFDASGSTDADNDPLTFTWDFGDGTTGTGAKPTHVFADNGVYVVTVSVSDGYNVSTGTVTVTVVNAPPGAAITGPTDGVPGQDRTFTFTATDPSSVDQGGPFTFQINWGDGTTQTVQASTFSIQVSHVFTATGSLSVSVTATDKDGDTSVAATQAITLVLAELQGGDLYVGGTASDDTITIHPVDANGTVDVIVNGQDQGTFVPTGQIVVYGQAGNDQIAVVPLTTTSGTVTLGLPVVLFGGDGNDVLDARGVSGSTVLVGGAGDDTLYGGSGPNVLVSGTGTNVLQGGNDSDLLIDGTTVYDNNLTALMAIRSEWSRTDADYQTRMDHLTGALAGGLNSNAVVNGQTVTSNGTLDSLFGSLGLDWYLVGSLNSIKDLEVGETYTLV
jgi:hypothetical protein